MQRAGQGELKMSRRSAFLLKSILSMAFMVIPIIVYFQYEQYPNYRTGGKVSKEDISKYFSNGSSVTASREFKQLLTYEKEDKEIANTIIKLYRNGDYKISKGGKFLKKWQQEKYAETDPRSEFLNLPIEVKTSVYRQMLEEEGIMQNFRKMVNTRKAIVYTGIPLSMIIGVLAAFIVPMIIRKSKYAKEQSIMQAQEEERRKREETRNAEAAKMRAAEKERERIAEAERNRIAEQQKKMREREIQEQEEFAIYCEGLNAEQANIDTAPVVLELINKYQEKELCGSTKKIIEAKAKEIEKEYKKQLIIAKAKKDIEDAKLKEELPEQELKAEKISEEEDFNL